MEYGDWRDIDNWLYEDLEYMAKRESELRAEITQLCAELAAYESALEEIATYDTGATAGLAYTAQRALATRRNK